MPQMPASLMLEKAFSVSDDVNSRMKKEVEKGALNQCKIVIKCFTWTEYEVLLANYGTKDVKNMRG